MVEPGQRTLAGRYELSELLATGGMGQVWRGRDVLLGRAVAIKVLRSEYTGDPTFLARFRAEAQHAALLAHRNIATVYDYGEVTQDDGAHEHLAYLVMELVEGEPLSTRLSRQRRLSIPGTLDLLYQTASALAVAHAAGVVHRDVKPGNVLMGDDGVIKITDFGIAWSASDVPLTQTGQVVGTAHYLSPEQADGGKASPASDVYALAMIGYECLAGRRAFEGENAVQIALRQIREVPEPLPADVPDPVRSLIGRAMLKDPAERFPDGAAFRDAVADVLAGRALPAPPPPLLPIDPGTTPMALPAMASAVVARSSPGGWRRVLAPVATLAVGVVIGGVALQFASGPPPPATTGSAAVGAAATGDGSGWLTAGVIRLAVADYVGRPYGAVENNLLTLGLRVTLVPTETAAVAQGLVTAVSPVGTLHPGDPVTVTYTVAPASPASAAPAPQMEQAGATAPAPQSAEPPAGSGGSGSGGSHSGGSDSGGSDSGGSDSGSKGHGEGHGHGHGGGD